MFLENLKLNFNEMLESKSKEIRELIATEFAYALLYNTRYEVDHSWDPPWDCSGKLVDTGESFNREDYELADDFFGECNGFTTASYVSGCGLFHETYERYLTDITLELLNSYEVEYFDKASQESKDELMEALDLKSPISEEDLWEELYQSMTHDLVFECATRTIYNLRKVRTEDLFKEGEFLAKEKKAKVEKDYEFRKNCNKEKEG